MSDAYIPQPDERRLHIDTALCRADCDCVPCRMCPVSAICRAPGEAAPTVNHRICLLCGGCLKACGPRALSITRE